MNKSIYSSLFRITIVIGFLYMAGKAIWFNLNHGDYYSYLLLACVLGIIMYGMISADKSSEIEKFSQDMGSEPIMTQSVEYLGGYPGTIITRALNGTVVINNNAVGFITNMSSQNFNVLINNIEEASIETKESLSVCKFIIVGVLAFALKDKEHYLRITFHNDINELSTIIFRMEKANTFLQTINKECYINKKQKMSI